MRFAGFGLAKSTKPQATNNQPLEEAIRTGCHLVIHGPDIQSEMLRVTELITQWMRRRDKWHKRMDDAGVDMGQFVRTLHDEPVKKGVYAFHSGPFATVAGVRRIKDPYLTSDLRSGILAVGEMDRSHFTIATQSGWTLIGCAGGGRKTTKDILVQNFDDVIQVRKGMI